MSDIVVRNTSFDEDLADAPELVDLARPILAKWEAAILRVATAGTRPQKFAARTPEAVLQQRFDRLSDVQKRRSAERAAETLKSARFQKRIGKFVVLKNLEAQPTVEGLLKSTPKPSIARKRLIEILEQRRVTLGLPESGKVAPPAFRKLSLGLIRVVCIDETNGPLGTEIGTDEIELGGVALDGTTNIGKITPFKVGDFERDGTRKELNNRKVFTFNLNDRTTYPKSFFVTFVMVEADNGNFSETMDDIIQKLAKESADKLAALIGGSIGSAAGPLGTLIGLLVGYIVGKVVSALISAWEDDPFNARTIEVIIPAFDAKLTNPESVVKFTGPGEYAMRYRWALSQRRA